MKVLVLNNMVPFVRGGAEDHCDHLVINLRKAGVEAEAFRIPFNWAPAERVLDEMFICRSLRLWNVDRVIALKFPAYLVPWPNKVMWIIHQFRQAYDLRDAGMSHLPDDEQGDRVQRAVRDADNRAFDEATAIYANSPKIAERARRYNGISPEVLRCPLPDPELFTGGTSEGYLIATGRVCAGKRQELLVRALRYAPQVRLRIIGPPESPEFAQHIQALAAREGVDDRLQFDLRYMTRPELAEQVNRSAGVVCAPFDEDSLSYVAMEAYHAKKPVLTVADAGGLLDIVVHGQTGLVVEPEPEAIGAAMAALIAKPNYAAGLGKAGNEMLKSFQLNWPSTVERLLS
jgi:glycosyltransferase involved in cell wall biosynthesis